MSGSNFYKPKHLEQPATCFTTLEYFSQSQKNFPPYVKARFLSEVMYLLDFTTFLPNSTHWGSWSDAFFLGIQAVESGDLKPVQALEVIENQIKNDLGNQIIIR